MTKKRIVLTFPQHLVDKPITYRLIKDYDLLVNILKANVMPNEQGVLVLEIEGKKHNVEEGIAFLKNSGVEIQSLIEDIKWDKKKCTHCTQCVAICPTNAFIVDRNTMRIEFDKNKCIACGICLTVCPYRAMEIVI